MVNESNSRNGSIDILFSTVVGGIVVVVVVLGSSIVVVFNFNFDRLSIHCSQFKAVFSIFTVSAMNECDNLNIYQHNYIKKNI